jgi:radical SAM/Cys-rich protein
MTHSQPLLRAREERDFDRQVEDAEGGPLSALSIDTVQVNIGLRCNLACQHCHVESSPKRKEEMDWPTMLLVLEAARKVGARTLDITGGAPEMHPHFRTLVSGAFAQGLKVMVRTNLTIILEPGYEDLPEFFGLHNVHLVASLPCYIEKNVDRQRGRGVFNDSVSAIFELNAVGYGEDPDLPLDLVYNPLGPHLPPPQERLEGDYRGELDRTYGIRFTRLIAIANMPIGRFLADLSRRGNAEEYMEVLKNAFNPGTLPGLMCRHQIHVGWDGTLYDCDFNFALGLPVASAASGHIRSFRPNELIRRRIATGRHCFGCTAGQGSSCGGALVQPEILKEGRRP